MYKYNYEREVYHHKCTQEFEDYKECKQRWQELRKKVMNGTLLETPPNPDKSPS